MTLNAYKEKHKVNTIHKSTYLLAFAISPYTNVYIHLNKIPGKLIFQINK